MHRGEYLDIIVRKNNVNKTKLAELLESDNLNLVRSKP